MSNKTQAEKKRYEVLNPVSMGGGRVERGSIVEVTEAEAVNIGTDYLKEVGTDTDTGTEDGEGGKDTGEDAGSEGEYKDDEDGEGGDAGAGAEGGEDTGDKAGEDGEAKTE